LQRIAREGLRPTVPTWVPPQLASLMRACWAEAEHVRPSSSEVVRHLWELLHARYSSSQANAGLQGIRFTGPRFVRVRRRGSFPRGPSWRQKRSAAHGACVVSVCGECLNCSAAVFAGVCVLQMAKNDFQNVE